jgi:molybdenum cofactor biosynthesis enzyme MoaA
MGICHSYAPDGRCISLLNILLTNACNYDCLYCVNRTTAHAHRAGLLLSARRRAERHAASEFSTNLIQYDVPNTMASSLKL